MKRLLSLLLLIVLIAIEVSLVADLLPRSWMPKTVVDYSSKDDPKDWSLITHPAMDDEIDQVIKEHPGLKLSFTLLEVLLIAGNAWLIYRLRKNLRSSGTRPRANDSN
jgi:hypothetical protein